MVRCATGRFLPGAWEGRCTLLLASENADAFRWPLLWGLVISGPLHTDLLCHVLPMWLCVGSPVTGLAGRTLELLLTVYGDPCLTHYHVWSTIILPFWLLLVTFSNSNQNPGFVFQLLQLSSQAQKWSLWVLFPRPEVQGQTFFFFFTWHSFFLGNPLHRSLLPPHPHPRPFISQM